MYPQNISEVKQLSNNGIEMTPGILGLVNLNLKSGWVILDIKVTARKIPFEEYSSDEDMYTVVTLGKPKEDDSKTKKEKVIL